MKKIYKKVKKRMGSGKDEKEKEKITGVENGSAFSAPSEGSASHKSDRNSKTEVAPKSPAVEDSLGKTEPKQFNKRKIDKDVVKPARPIVDPLLGEVQGKEFPSSKPTLPLMPKNTFGQPQHSLTFQQPPPINSRNDFIDPPNLVKSYAEIPTLDHCRLPRGGISVETEAVGRVQFGIPPETIKDSMRLGLDVPQVYIVPVERFCREMGPALGVNLAEFEFPAYFNYFVCQRKCTLIVDSMDAEQNIRRVFSETLLGPAQFRRENPIAYEPEDFSPDFPRDDIPNFQKELLYFRTMPDGHELALETLLQFKHFQYPNESSGHENLGVPPPLDEMQDAKENPDCIFEVNEEEEEPEEAVPKDARGVEKREKSNWTYSQARWMGHVATVWERGATEEQIKARSVARVEIFKLPGGTEYVLHDIDKNNHIIGKSRFSGHVKVSEQMSIDGFGGHSFLDDVQDDMDANKSLKLIQDPPKRFDLPRTFNPPSFGVTVLGNSHGFDKNGSTSGYVLWINGRGVMIDPPPYSTFTLEREGIRPRMIVGIIITHCHADHDAGSFQKILTGSPVVVITTPTIYKSFIRKYAALSALSPALLRHSHRHKPAIIGEPLRFQGATFNFTYTFHMIPCVGFRVEWRGRSMVFTGDHLNHPKKLDTLQQQGVFTKGRADALQLIPYQETDLLLHEQGPPPAHTPLEVLLELPERIKEHLYVVHTQGLPEGCELRVAPTGTAGTIRLDQLNRSRSRIVQRGLNRSGSAQHHDSDSHIPSWGGANSEYGESSESPNKHDPMMMNTSFASLAIGRTGSTMQHRGSSTYGDGSVESQIPLVSLRPASSTDAWFILNLLSSVPFLSSLSYASTMEVLETCRVDAYCVNGVIVHAARRPHTLCVVWEGTCAERYTESNTTLKRMTNPLSSIGEMDEYDSSIGAVWYAGDWTGPIALQPEKALSGKSDLAATHDVVAISTEGVKVITIDICYLHPILKTGSALYRKFLERMAQQERAQSLELSEGPSMNATEELLSEALRNLNILELLNCNSALRKLSAVQKRQLESLAEGPASFMPGERIWRSGAPVDRAFIIVSGTASFVPRRRNAGSANVSLHSKFILRPESSDIGEEMRQDALKAIQELGKRSGDRQDEESSTSSVENKKADDSAFQFDSLFVRSGESAHSNDDFGKLSRTLQKHAEHMYDKACGSTIVSTGDSSLGSGEQVEMVDDTESSSHEAEGLESFSKDRRAQMVRRRSSKARFANKVLGRLYSRRAFTGGLIFSRGHFLGDVSKMVAGSLSSDVSSELNEDSSPSYGFGEMSESGENHQRGQKEVSVNLAEMVIHEQGSQSRMHSSTLTAGKEGCVVLVFPKSSLIPFLDDYPGLLLSLLGTQVVV